MTNQRDAKGRWLPLGDVAMVAAERSLRYRAKLGREEVNARARDWYAANRDRVAERNRKPEIRERRRVYMALYRAEEAA
jgi:hypothetical protein